MNQKQGYNGLGLSQGTTTVSACRTYKNYSNQDSQSPSRHFTAWPPRYETTVLTIKTFGKSDSDIQKEDAPSWIVSLQIFLCYWSEA